MNFLNNSRNSIYIVFDGTKEDLIKKIDNVSNVLGKNNFYNNDINKIKNNILSNFNKYKEYTIIYYGNIILKNKSLSGYNPYFLESNIKNSSDKSLYNWDYTKILLYLLVIFIIFFIILISYCYIFNINIYQYILNLIF